MAESGFEVAFEGPALADGRMEVRDLAPALLALADLFREANDVLHPDESTVSLQIRATRDGSFDIDLILVFAGWAASVLTSDEVTALANLKELVLGDDGIFGLVKRLAGRSVRSTRVQPEHVEYTTEDGDRLTVPRFTHDAFQRVQLRRRTREFLQPLDRPGVDKVVLRETEVDHVIELSQPPPPEPLVSAVPDRPLTSHDREEFALEITGPSFREGNKWRLSDGTNQITATMNDDAFMERVARREEAFLMGDLLVCDVHVEQHARPGGGLRTEYTITRVREHISPPPGAAPPRLFEGQEDGCILASGVGLPVVGNRSQLR